MTKWAWPLRAVAVSLLAGASACADTSHPGVHAAALPSEPRSCFRNGDVSSWTDVDRQTINIRVNIHDYYQLKLFAPCGDIDFSQRVGLRSRAGTDFICSGLDADIIAPTPIGRETCPVVSIHKFTAEEVAALPNKQKP